MPSCAARVRGVAEHRAESRGHVPDDEGDEEDPYLHKVRRAGGFPQYETQVTKSLAEIFEPKFPKLPAEVIRTIVAFWAHVGDY